MPAHGLFGGGQMPVRWVKLSRPTQKFVDLLYSGRCHVRISSQRLSDEGVGLHLVEQLLPLERQLLYLLRRIGRGQGLIGGIELLTKLIGFGPKRNEFLFRAFILPEGGNGLNDFVLIDLRREIDMDHYIAAFDARTGLLIENRDDAGGVRPDFIARNVEVFDFGYALQIGRDLLEGVAFGGLNGQPSGVCPRVMIPHTGFAC